MRGKSKIEDIIHILSEEGKAKEEAEEKRDRREESRITTGHTVCFQQTYKSNVL